ncbi:hypothetical protein [uncultured Kordia sp.]|uniref:hypothetical protein n=1 Tax=uncultured Kordia sp. TaxID=507699 RepID=UPI0026176A99|nr:hypothetical protein [uncultured Kordia sp.]
MKKKFSRSLMLNKKSVASLTIPKNVRRQIVGGNDNNTQCETCEINCIPDTVEPSCDGTCWYSECHCSGNEHCHTGDRDMWGPCS